MQRYISHRQQEGQQVEEGFESQQHTFLTPHVHDRLQRNEFFVLHGSLESVH